ncbi:S-adenosyl-L-methionine-dependent methyltransferase [Polychytrium aggregatum]|uniref:S-adenosyl-L-methionine-dependent methyltransferase n=1 Tax=Polychytrium aggregatum TaxID=110093 RepID=UPI0022FDB12D|nr:S-adenosyl-L-methionine-dependent methyltransferase [Polychytrium aggregatum]KAI9205414.1 S-adenosyl-L-methionine-dependent methyltransferase [Polychytrium aggregatum]
MATTRQAVAALVLQFRMAAGSDAEASSELRWCIEELLQRRIRPSHHFPRKTAASRLPRTAKAADALELLSTLHGSEEALVRAYSGLDRAERRRLDRWAELRSRSHKPLQYLLRSQPFLGLDITVRPPTLIPRWETEEWVERLITQIRKSLLYQPDRRHPIRILDLCSGSGCIALALAHHLNGQPLPSQPHSQPQFSVTGIDISARAIALARINQRRLGIGNAEFHQADLTDPHQLARALHPEGYHILVANPPYIPRMQYQRLAASVKDWEDAVALESGGDGLELIRTIVKHINQESIRLIPTEHTLEAHNPGPTPAIALEINGCDQSQETLGLLRSIAQIKRAEVWQDLAGHDRAAVGYWS